MTRHMHTGSQAPIHHTIMGESAAQRRTRLDRAIRPTERHATYVTAEDFLGDRVTFRVGQPVDWDAAQRRWLRMDEARRGRGLVLRWHERMYRVLFAEVRTVDRHGRGLGSERHAQAFNVPCRTVRLGAPASYPWKMAA